MNLSNVFLNGILGSQTENKKNLKDKKNTDVQYTNLFSNALSDIDDAEQLQKMLDAKKSNNIFGFSTASVGDSLELKNISTTDIEERLEQIKKAEEQKEKDSKQTQQNKKGNGAVASSKDSRQNSVTQNNSQTVTTSQSSTKANQEDEASGKGTFKENYAQRQSAIKSGKFNKSDYTSSGSGSTGATYKGIKIAGAALGYIGDVDSQKNWTENKLSKARQQKSVTKKEQFRRKQAPKTKSIVPNAGEVEDLQNTTKGSKANVGSSKKESSSQQVQMSKHSQGATEAMGQVSGAVENIKNDFTQNNNEQNCEGFKDIISGVDESKQNESNGLSTFEGAKTATSSLENEQERNAQQGDAATEKALEATSEKEAASGTINDAISQLNNANQLTQEGNSDIDAGMAAIEEAEDLADEAKSLAGESKTLQNQGLKKLQESSNKMQKGVNLTKQGDELTGTGQALIHTGVPLTFSIFTVGIGVALISTGLGLAASGKAKTESGNNQVRQGQKARTEGMKKFDNGTKKANESKEVQDEATAKNDEATELSDNGSAKIENASEQKSAAQKQKKDGERDYNSAKADENRYTNISVNCAKATERVNDRIQLEMNKSQEALGTILSAKTNAEDLTGVKGNNSNTTGEGKAQSSNVDPKEAASKEGTGIAGALAGLLGDAFNLSDAMKNITYKKSLKNDKKDNKKTNDKTKQQQNQNKQILANKPNGNNKSNNSIFTASASNKAMKPVSIFARG